MSEDRVLALFILARQQEAAGITGVQFRAVEQLKELSAGGNTKAAEYLIRLRNLPDVHPFVKEVLQI